MSTPQEKKMIKDIAKELNDRDRSSLYMAFAEEYSLDALESILMEV